jgi:hypothetical protein
MKWEVLMAMAVKITVCRVWCRVFRCSSEKRPLSIFKGGGTLLRNIDLLNYTTSHPRKRIFSSLIKRSVGVEEKVTCVHTSLWLCLITWRFLRTVQCKSRRMGPPHIVNLVTCAVLCGANLLRRSDNAVATSLGFFSFFSSSLCYTSCGTRRCSGWPVAKPDRFFSYITKSQNNLWTCITVKCAPCHPRKTAVLTQNTQTRKKKKEDIVNECSVLFYK